MSDVLTLNWFYFFPGYTVHIIQALFVILLRKWNPASQLYKHPGILCLFIGLQIDSIFVSGVFFIFNSSCILELFLSVHISIFYFMWKG